MPKSIEYIGTTRGWPELPITGRQSTWFPGQIEQRSDTEAAALLATGQFMDIDATQLPENKVVALSGVVSADGICSTGLRTVLFGHSYLDQETVSGSGVWNGFQANGTVAWLNALMDCPLQIVKEYALGGFRLLDLFPRYKAEIEQVYRPHVLFICIGHNDIKGLYPSGGSNQPLTQLGADPRQVELPYLMAKWDDLLRNAVSPATKVFILAENPPGRNPAGSQSATTTAQLAVRYLQYNDGLRQLARKFNNVVFLPADRATVDPSSTIATNRAGYNSDQVHPGVIGSYKRATAILPYVQKVLPIHVDPLPWSAADTHSNAALTSTAAPSGDGAALTIPLANVNAGIRRIVVGDRIVVQPTNAADVAVACRATVIEATDTAIKVPHTLNGVAAAAMKVSNSRQLLINPLFLTTTGGGAANSGINGTLSGTLPLGVNIAGLPAGWTVTVSTEAHTLRDGSAGYGNWLVLAITNTSGAAGTFQVQFPAHGRDNTPVSYDVWRKAFLGETYQFGAEIRQSGATGGWNGYQLLMTAQNMDASNESSVDGAQTSARWGYRDGTIPNTADHPFPPDDHRLTAVTPEYALPAVAGKRLYGLTPRIEVAMSGNGSATLRIGRVGCWAVDDIGQAERISLQTA